MDDSEKFIQSGGTPIWANDKGLKWEFERDGIRYTAYFDWSEKGFQGFGVNEDGKFIIPYENSLPPITDPIDKLILEWVTYDPDLSDTEIGLKLADYRNGEAMSRQSANARRKRLERMGYKVR